MEKQPISELMASSIERIKDMVDANTVVGNPIETAEGTTVIPVSRLSFGFASGGDDKNPQNKGIWGGAGAAVRVSPVGFLIVKDGGVRMLNLTPPAGSTVDRVLDMIPEMLDRVEGYVDKYALGSKHKED